MWKAALIFTAIRLIIGIAVIGVAVSYMSRSIDGVVVSYVSLDSFLRAIGACDAYGNCDIAYTSGCFLCKYVEQLFFIIGDAAYAFWDALIGNIWILMSVGFVIFLFHHSYKHIRDANAAAATQHAQEKKFDFKAWFDPVWKLGVRVFVVGALLGVVGYGGAPVVKTVADVTITPVMFIGSSLATVATGISDTAACGSGRGIEREGTDILGPALQPFMCVIGNLNAVVLAGAAGGFALMNYTALGIGGGLWTWVAGLGIVIMFMFIGFNIFFKILSVVFQLVFLIIFLPLFMAAWAYEKEWTLMAGSVSNAIGMLAKCAVRIIAITLQILIFYGMVQFVAIEFFPGTDESRAAGYTVLLPAGILDNQGMGAQGPTDRQTASVMEVFSRCEAVGTADGVMNKNAFRDCFRAERAKVEAIYPGAFDFMRQGWSFLWMMIGLIFVYFFAVMKKVEDMLLGGKDNTGDDLFGSGGGTPFEYGSHVRQFGMSIWGVQKGIVNKIEGIFKP
ncbi:MAG: hypothetical protein FWE17_02400 [Alphaproteobacteria bacterium]|nr:hypothetical protein [Alphaproteobacteria bacterium]MCL2757884.1 hypothetical protein [Alphaproteobacteria bacterium]